MGTIEDTYGNDKELTECIVSTVLYPFAIKMQERHKIFKKFHGYIRTSDITAQDRIENWLKIYQENGCKWFGNYPITDFYNSFVPTDQLTSVYTEVEHWIDLLKKLKKIP